MLFMTSFFTSKSKNVIRKVFYFSLFLWGNLLGAISESKGQLVTPIPSNESVDSFRVVIADGFNLNERIVISDALNFVQTGIYSFINYDETSSFHDVLLCYEYGYNKEPEPHPSLVAAQQLRMKRDIRWLFLFYLDQYALRSFFNNNQIHKTSRIHLLNIKKDDYEDILGDKGFDLVIKIYQKLIIAMNKQSFYEQVVRDQKISMMEFIGYKWEIRD